MRTKKYVRLFTENIIAWIISITLMAPLMLIVFNSLKTTTAAAGMPFRLPTYPLVFDNFSIVVVRGNLIPSFFNSLLYSGASVLICTLLALMAAYVISRRRTKLHNFLYFFITLGIAVPINFVTLMRAMQILNLFNTRLGIILIFASIQIPFAFFLSYAFIGKIPREIDEAGVIDGCSPLRLFFFIVFPLLKPVMVTVMVLSFLNTWNNFIIPLYFLGTSSKWPMTLAVFNFFGLYSMEWNLISAFMILSSLPVVTVYLLGQKYIVTGMTAGSVKG